MHAVVAMDDARVPLGQPRQPANVPLNVLDIILCTLSAWQPAHVEDTSIQTVARPHQVSVARCSV